MVYFSENFRPVRMESTLFNDSFMECPNGQNQRSTCEAKVKSYKSVQIKQIMRTCYQETCSLFLCFTKKIWKIWIDLKDLTFVDRWFSPKATTLVIRWTNISAFHQHCTKSIYSIIWGIYVKNQRMETYSRLAWIKRVFESRC